MSVNTRSTLHKAHTSTVIRPAGYGRLMPRDDKKADLGSASERFAVDEDRARYVTVYDGPRQARRLKNIRLTSVPGFRQTCPTLPLLFNAKESLSGILVLVNDDVVRSPNGADGVARGFYHTGRYAEMTGARVWLPCKRSL